MLFACVPVWQHHVLVSHMWHMGQSPLVTGQVAVMVVILLVAVLSTASQLRIPLVKAFHLLQPSFCSLTAQAVTRGEMLFSFSGSFDFQGKFRFS